MEMNVFILFFVSLPEAFLNLILILLVSERKSRLEISRPNVVRFSATLALMLAASWFLRPLAPSPAFNMLFHIAAYLLIITLVYKINLGTVFLSVIMVMLFILTIENTFIPFIIAYKIKDLSAFFGNNATILVCSLPDRILQCLAVFLLWKYNEVFLITRINKKIRAVFIACNLIFIFAQAYFSSIYAAYFGSLSLAHQISYALVLVILLIAFDLLVFTLVYLTVKGVMLHGYSRYRELEDNAKYAFNEVYNLLKCRNDTGGAVSLLEELIGKEEKQEEINKTEVRKDGEKISTTENGGGLQRASE